MSFMFEHFSSFQYSVLCLFLLMYFCYVMLWLQLETTAERIKAVDHAAAIVEEMLKQATVSSGAKVILTPERHWKLHN